MARYRKVSVRIWADAKVRQLSAPPPNGRDCWLYLMTAKESTNIPGLVPAGAAAIAETLRWSVDGFLGAFAEVHQLELAQADWHAGLVWIPKAIHHNPPENPNVVKGWAETWEDLIPECPLKLVAYEALRAVCEEKGEAFVEAFDDCIPRPKIERVQVTVPERVPPTLSTGLPKSGTGAVAGTGAVKGDLSSASPPTPEPLELAIDAPPADPEAEVFAHYRLRLGKTEAVKLDDARRKQLRARLKRWSVADLKLAVDAFTLSDWHMGRDPKTNGKRFDGPKYVFKDDERVEEWLDLARVRASELPPPPTAPMSPTDTVWAEALERIRREKPYAATSLAQLRAVSVADGRLTLEFPDRYAQSWVQEHYPGVIEAALAAQNLTPEYVTKNSEAA